MTDGTPTSAVSRRRLLGYAGAGAAIGAAGFAGGLGTARATDGPAEGAAGRYPFHGRHQAGIVTPAQDRLHFAAFDVTATSRAELLLLLKAWTAAASAMTQGRPVGGDTALPYDSPAADTGEASGLPPSRLTLTFGFGPSLFRDAEGRDRFGLAGRQPKALRRLPHFPADALVERRSDGDLCVQACADDPQVAVHAIRNLSRIAFGTAALRWSQLGFGRTSSTSRAQATPRNLFGFKDGTRNLKAEDTDLLRDHVWVQPGDGPAWLEGGSYLVARRIRMHIEVWDRTSLTEQESIIGRNKGEGAPAGSPKEFDEPNLANEAIAPDAHIRLAAAQNLGGVRILRRGYNFVDGSDGQGHLNAGLFFLAYMRNPQTHFVPMQRALAGKDRLMEYIEHTGSAVYAIPRGLGPQDYWGQSLLEA